MLVIPMPIKEISSLIHHVGDYNVDKRNKLPYTSCW